MFPVRTASVMQKKSLDFVINLPGHGKRREELSPLSSLSLECSAVTTESENPGSAREKRH